MRQAREMLVMARRQGLAPLQQVELLSILNTHALRCILHLLNYLPLILFRWQWDVWLVALGRYDLT